MAEAGISVVRIATRLRRSVEAVKGRAKTLRVKIVSMQERRSLNKQALGITDHVEDTPNEKARR
jgi:hypothetical protein